jgi:hypothetical protein
MGMAKQWNCDCSIERRYTVTGLDAESKELKTVHFTVDEAFRRGMLVCKMHKGCTKQPKYMVRYSQRSGSGRAGSRDRWSCEEHAVQFAKKHGIEMPFDVKDDQQSLFEEGQS